MIVERKYSCPLLTIRILSPTRFRQKEPSQSATERNGNHCEETSCDPPSPKRPVRADSEKVDSDSTAQSGDKPESTTDNFPFSSLRKVELRLSFHYHYSTSTHPKTQSNPVPVPSSLHQPEPTDPVAILLSQPRHSVWHFYQTPPSKSVAIFGCCPAGKRT